MTGYQPSAASLILFEQQEPHEQANSLPWEVEPFPFLTSPITGEGANLPWQNYVWYHVVGGSLP